MSAVQCTLFTNWFLCFLCCPLCSRLQECSSVYLVPCSQTPCVPGCRSAVQCTLYLVHKHLVSQAAGVQTAAALPHPHHSAACHPRAFHKVITVLLGWSIVFLQVLLFTQGSVRFCTDTGTELYMSRSTIVSMGQGICILSTRYTVLPEDFSLLFPPPQGLDVRPVHLLQADSEAPPAPAPGHHLSPQAKVEYSLMERE